MIVERLANKTLIRLPAQIDQGLIEVIVEYFRLIEAYYQEKNMSTKLFLLKAMENLYFEYLAQKAGFEQEFLDKSAEEIKADWWQQNKERVLKRLDRGL